MFFSNGMFLTALGKWNLQFYSNQEKVSRISKYQKVANRIRRRIQSSCQK